MTHKRSAYHVLSIFTGCILCYKHSLRKTMSVQPEFRVEIEILEIHAALHNLSDNALKA